MVAILVGEEVLVDVSLVLGCQCGELYGWGDHVHIGQNLKIKHNVLLFSRDVVEHNALDKKAQSDGHTFDSKSF